MGAKKIGVIFNTFSETNASRNLRIESKFNVISSVSTLLDGDVPSGFLKIDTRRIILIIRMFKHVLLKHWKIGKVYRN